MSLLLEHAPSRRQWLIAGVGTVAGLLAGCATPSRPGGATASNFWSGRMALQLEDTASIAAQNPQSFSASFELQGSPQEGSLQLFTPLGSSVALIRWQPGAAELLQGNDRRTSPSLNTLVRDTLGTDIPVPALFAWLQGQPQSIEGWSVDLAGFAEGRIAAVRHTPAPQARLRLILDR